MKVALGILVGVLLGFALSRLTLRQSQGAPDASTGSGGETVEPSASSSGEIERLKAENMRLRALAAARTDVMAPDFSGATNAQAAIALDMQEMMRTNPGIARMQDVMKEQARLKIDATMLRLQQQLGLTPEQAAKLSLALSNSEPDIIAMGGDSIQTAEGSATNLEASLAEFLSPEQMTNYARIKQQQEDRTLRAQGLTELNEIQEMTGFDDTVADQVLDAVVKRSRMEENGDQAQEDADKFFAGQMALILSPAQLALFQRWQQLQKDLISTPFDVQDVGDGTSVQGSSQGWTSYGVQKVIRTSPAPK